MLDKPKTIFFSYSHKDEDLRDLLADHLSLMIRNKLITAWHDREITAGTEWKSKIDEHLEKADLILLLISANFLASDYCYDVEMKRAMKRYELSEVQVIPIILKPVDWSGAPFSKLQALPRNAKPVTSWDNLDEAMLNIAKGIRQVVSAENAPTNLSNQKFMMDRNKEIPPDKWFSKKKSKIGGFLESLFEDN